MLGPEFEFAETMLEKKKVSCLWRPAIISYNPNNPCREIGVKPREFPKACGPARLCIQQENILCSDLQMCTVAHTNESTYTQECVWGVYIYTHKARHHVQDHQDLMVGSGFE